MKLHIIAIMQAMQQPKGCTDDPGRLITIKWYGREIGSGSARVMHGSTVTNMRRNAIAADGVGCDGASHASAHDCVGSHRRSNTDAIFSGD